MTVQAIFEQVKQFGNDIGWLSNILGAGLLAVAAVAFKLIRKVRDKRRLKKRLLAAKAVVTNAGEFRIGKISDQFIIVEGNGAETFAKVATRENPTHVQLPSEVHKELERITRELENQEDAHFKLYNGDIYSFTNFRISRTESDESACIDLEFNHSKYYEFLAVDRLARDPVFRSTYLAESIRARKPKYCLGFGIALTIITADNKLVVPRRSENVSVWKNKYTVSANEALSRMLDRNEKGQPDVYFAAQRAAKEELGVDIPIEAIRFYALGFETISLQWALLGTAKTDLIAQDIEDSFRTTAKDKFEHAALHFIDFTPEAVIGFINNNADEMIPGCKAQFIMSLFNHGADIEHVRAVALGSKRPYRHSARVGTA
jgi:hypothetical protein